MDDQMLKKIGGGALALGGLLSLIGAIGGIANSTSMETPFDSAFKATVGMSILARIGAIIAFVAAIVLIAAVFRTNGSKKGAAITGAVFAVIAFIGQFMINPLTSEAGLFKTNYDYSDTSAAATAVIGLLLLAAAGIATLITGIISLVSKNGSAR